jgi:flagellar hook-basal body complex protein FliE
MRINDILPVAPLAPTGAAPKSSGASDFQGILKDAIHRVEISRTSANEAVEQFVTGENQDLHSIVLKTQRASLDFDLLLQVRNKVVQSYQEIMRMQL